MKKARRSLRLDRSARARARAVAISLALGGLALVACAHPVYRPRSETDAVGYSDQQITTTRYRVTFAGSAATSLSDVQDYLLLRAAEVTLKAGYNHFYFAHRATDAHTDYRFAFPDAYSETYGPLNAARSDIDMYTEYSDLNPLDSRWRGPGTDKRYTASSEIVMLTFEEAAHQPLALSARDILARLGEKSRQPNAPASD